jgi:hypothetical protein
MFFLAVFVGMPSHPRFVPDTFVSFEVIKQSDLDELKKKSKPLLSPPEIKEEKFVDAKQSFQPVPQEKSNDAVPGIKIPPKAIQDKSLDKVLDSVVKEESINKQFDSMLKNVEKTNNKKKTIPTSNNKTVKDVLDSIDSSLDTGVEGASSLSATEEEAIRRQIYPNWFVPAGIKDAENIIVEIEVRLSETGEVVSAKILDEAKCMSQHSTRVAAESARRAVMLSSPIKVPPSLKGTLKKIILRFNPKDVLG